MLASERILQRGIGTANDLGFTDRFDESIPHVGPVHEHIRYPFLETGEVQSSHIVDAQRVWRVYTLRDGTRLVVDQWPSRHDDQKMPQMFGRISRSEYADQEIARRRVAFLSRHYAYMPVRAGDDVPISKMLEESLAQLAAWKIEHPQPIVDVERVPVRGSGIAVTDRERGGDGFLPQV